MKIEEVKKITRYDDYTINEFVKGLKKTRVDVEKAKDDIDQRAKDVEEKAKTLSGELESADSDKLNSEMEKLEIENADIKKDAKKIESTLKKWTDEKERILNQLKGKISKSEASIIENENKLKENEEVIKQNEEKMSNPDLDQNSDEYMEMDKQNKELRRKNSYLRGNITRYANKINKLRRTIDDLENENVIEGMVPPKRIVRARTKSGKSTNKGKTVAEIMDNISLIGEPKVEPIVKLDVDKKDEQKSELKDVKNTESEIGLTSQPKVEPNPETNVKYTQEQLLELLRARQAMGKEAKITSIEVDPLMMGIKYKLSNETVERKIEGLDYLGSHNKEFNNEIKKYLPPETKLKNVVSKVDPNIVSLIKSVYGEDNVTKPMQQYIEALSGKTSNLNIVYNLNDIYKSKLTREEIKNIIKTAKRAEKGSNGFIKVERDSLFKRILGNINRRINPIKLIGDGKRENNKNNEIKKEKAIEKLSKRYKVELREVGRTSTVENNKKEDKDMGERV